NLMYPTETAVTLTGATSTTFNEAAVVNENPELSFDNDDQVWKASSESPILTNTLSLEELIEDIEGQARPLTANYGADHYSLETISYTPLTPDDVGPNSYVDQGTSISAITAINELLIYPVPADKLLTIDTDGLKISRVEIATVNGKVVQSTELTRAEAVLTLNTTDLPNGLYLLKMYSSDGSSVAKKFVVRH
ncbi:T9SS type A sorting domain-containing protein, partial [Chitinophagales bacterium]|nr:T9SS type A sorting domain-containing protein [Chitinophagales bacterium]